MAKTTRKRMGFTANTKTYNWVKKGAKDLGVTMSAYIALKLGEQMKQEQALDSLQTLTAEVREMKSLQKNT